MEHKARCWVAGTSVMLEEGRVAAGVRWRGVDQALKTSIFKPAGGMMEETINDSEMAEKG